jgi:hypothetical protein
MSAPAVSCWTAAHVDLHWADVTAPLRLLDREGWGQAPEGFDAATLYAYSPLQEDAATRVRDTFPVLDSPAGLAAEATVCAQLLQTVSRGDNLALADQLRDCSAELRRHRRLLRPVSQAWRPACPPDATDPDRSGVRYGRMQPHRCPTWRPLRARTRKPIHSGRLAVRRHRAGRYHQFAQWPRANLIRKAPCEIRSASGRPGSDRRP